MRNGYYRTIFAARRYASALAICCRRRVSVRPSIRHKLALYQNGYIYVVYISPAVTIPLLNRQPCLSYIDSLARSKRVDCVARRAAL